MNSNLAPRVGLLLCVVGLLACPASVLAVDCASDNIILTTQNEVDNFQSTYGPCDHVGLLLSIGPSVDISNLDGLSGLIDVNLFLISGNSSLTDITGLSTLVASDGFLIENNPLTNLNGLSGLTSLPGGLSLLDNPLLSNLNALSGITDLGSLTIAGNDAVANLDSLSGLTTMTGDITIINNAALTDISGLAGASGFQSIDIRQNPLLTSLDGLQGETALTGLILEDNDSLTNVDPLAGVASVGNLNTEMQIIGNDNLINLNGLASLVSVDAGVRVNNNVMLGECSALSTLLDGIDDGEPGPGPGAAGIPDVNGDVTVSFNAVGCNSIAEVVGSVDLSVDVLPGTLNLTQGDSQAFEFTVSNQGPETANQVIVTAEFDGAVDEEVIPPMCSFTLETSTLLCILPDLPPGVDFMLNPEFRFPAPAVTALTVTVSANEADPEPADNMEMVPISVTDLGGTNLAARVEITDGPNELGHILSGSTMLTVRASTINHGSGSATGVTKAVTMPGDWVIDSHDPMCTEDTPPDLITLTCPLANLAPGETEPAPTTEFVVVPNSDGDITVTVSANEPDPLPSSNTKVLAVDVRTFSEDLSMDLNYQSSGWQNWLLNDAEFLFNFIAKSSLIPPDDFTPTIGLKLAPVDHVSSAVFDVDYSDCTDESTIWALEQHCTRMAPVSYLSIDPNIAFQVDQPGEWVATAWVDSDTAYDPDTSNNWAESSMTILPPPPVRVRAIEVNQVVQDWNNSVVLLEGKPTVVRVFLEDDELNKFPYTGRLLGLRGGIPVAGSPLLPLNGKIRADEDALADRTSMPDTVNFLLPDNWTQEGALELVFDLQAKGRPVDCVVPNALPAPDCRIGVSFVSAVVPELDVLGAGFTTDEVQRLIFDCSPSPCSGGVIDPTSTITLDFGPDGETDPILVLPLMGVNVNDRSLLLEAGIGQALGLQGGQVVARRLRGTALEDNQLGYRISIRNQQDYPLIVVDESNLSGATTSIVKKGEDADGGEYQPPPSLQNLFAQVGRLIAMLPLVTIDTRYAFLADFDFKPTTHRDINPVLDVYRLMQDSQCAVCRTDAMRVGGYLHQHGVEGSGGNAMNRVYSSYIGGATGMADFRYAYTTGSHEFSHSFGKEHAVVEPDGDGTRGLCNSTASAGALLHPHVQEIPGLENTKLKLEGYSPETFPTIGPLDQGDDNEIWGIDIRFLTGGSASPVVSPYETVDYMSYCYIADKRKWASDFSYLEVKNGLDTGAVGTPDDVGQVGDIVYVAGTINESGQAEIAVMAGATAPMPDQEAGTLRVAFVDAGDAELSAVNVAMQLGDGRQDEIGDGTPEPPIPTAFVAAVPHPGSGVAALIVGETADPMIRIDASDNAPTVDILSPTMGTVITSNDLLVEWSSFDADGDLLHATVYYSADGGGTWNTMGLNLTGDSLTIPGDQLAMSDVARIKVSVSDGIWYSEAISEPFIVDNSAPVISIISPPFQESADYKLSMYRLEAVAWDTEDGNLPLETVEWASDLDGPLGTGVPLDLTISDLTPGCHNISVSVMDSEGAIGIDTQEMCVGEYIFSGGFEFE